MCSVTYFLKKTMCRNEAINEIHGQRLPSSLKIPSKFHIAVASEHLRNDQTRLVGIFTPCRDPTCYLVGWLWDWPMAHGHSFRVAGNRSRRSWSHWGDEGIVLEDFFALYQSPGFQRCHCLAKGFNPQRDSNGAIPHGIPIPIVLVVFLPCEPLFN